MTRTVTTSLTELFKHAFFEKTRSKGLGYFRGGAVNQFQGGTHEAVATVAGDDDVYAVTFAYESQGDALRCHCTCPAFENSPCKHLWTVLLTAEKEGALSAVVANRCTNLLPDFEPLDEDDEDDEDEGYEGYDEDEWDEEDDGTDPPSPGMMIDLGNGDRINIMGGSDVLARLLPFMKKSAASGARSLPPPAAPKVAPWKAAIDTIMSGRRSRTHHEGVWTNGRQAIYILDLSRPQRGQALSVELATQERKINGDWSKPRDCRFHDHEITSAPDPRDRRALEALQALGGSRDNPYYTFGSLSSSSPIPLREACHEFIIPQLCATRRCWLRLTEMPDAELIRLTWDDGPPWKLQLEVSPTDTGDFTVTGVLRRHDESMSIHQPRRLLKSGVMFVGDTATRFDDGGDFQWIVLLRQHGHISVPRADGDQLVRTLLTMPMQVPVRLPEQLQVEEVVCPPRPMLQLSRQKSFGGREPDSMDASLRFDYEDQSIPMSHEGDGLMSATGRRLLRRDRQAESAAVEQLLSNGFRVLSSYDRNQGRQDRDMDVKIRKLHAALPMLIAAGWRVEAEGKAYRSAGAINIKVSSGIDWFELDGQAMFDDQHVELPQLLAALGRGENTIVLGDGTLGMLPQEWLAKYGTLAALGTEEKDHIRFSRTQVALLDALLASMPEATCDELFQQTRDRLRRFEGIRPADAPRGFGGELRPYQREGLGWLQFLREFRFGGCLADDMGLGKTIQVLAMLDARRIEKQNDRSMQADPTDKASAAAAMEGPLASVSPRPSIIVLPRSLVFNWRKEAAKFTPQLRLLDHTGIDRICRGEDDHTPVLNEYDLILTTYGTLRSDAAKLKDVRFDYVILDEAQAIKNASTANAKAVRLLQGDHRLVLTGTPVENRLSDLWSLFEFLNPGMLGGANVFKRLGGDNNGESDDARRLLAKALRPFILRRKKEQVARDLPAKVEQTLYCELEPKQRKLYNQLREHYRKSLLGRIEKNGLAKSKMHVLEALLRLRQAACHPGLIDDKLRKDSGAKLDALMPRLEELIAEGHKVLVFSQFTSLLAIVRTRLDASKITYEYLDGQTKDRQARVDRFQNDPNCPLFLISLKAGGVGLNLTAAEHVFLLDPWWNPAVEAQAIDRAHRIGQTRQVFAFRLIARDTVEEKVLELQSNKRELADAIINEDNSLISRMGREELEMLLS